MDLRELSNFLKIAEYENITRAAEELHIAQPHLTRQLKSLEEELGVSLFIREKKRLHITDEGRFLKQQAEQMLGLAQKTKEQISEMESGIMCKITDIVMHFSPIGVCALMACVTGQYGTDIFGPLAKFILCVFGSQLLVLVGLYSIMLKFIAKVPLKDFYKKMVPVWLMTLSTTSSSATLPLSTKTTTKDFGVSDQLAGFTLPLGATINMNGAVCFYAIATIFVAQIYGVDFGIVKQISLILLTTRISVGSPGIPGGAIVMTTMLLSNMGLPLDAVGVLAGINRLIDMGDTSLNVTGDIVSTLCIARTEKMFEEESYEAAVENAVPVSELHAEPIGSYSD